MHKRYKVRDAIPPVEATKVIAKLNRQALAIVVTQMNQLYERGEKGMLSGPDCRNLRDLTMMLASLRRAQAVEDTMRKERKLARRAALSPEQLKEVALARPKAPQDKP